MRGGKRAGSGRKKLPETIVMRVPVSLVDKIKQMIAELKQLNNRSKNDDQKI